MLRNRPIFPRGRPLLARSLELGPGEFLGTASPPFFQFDGVQPTTALPGAAGAAGRLSGDQRVCLPCRPLLQTLRQ